MTRRSLVLAGGGMRVAWQAGALAALDEEGVSFEHVDGTSGGIINAAMLLSGVTPAEMCERWITLPVRRFASPLRLRTYLRGSSQLPALGDADGVVGLVFPHLGIDVAAIRAQTGFEGTFNVCNFADKTVEAIPHTEVAIDHLVAGISMPIAMPVVERGGVPYTDAVWVKDANLLEGVRRGADELWLLWCIANTSRYGEGAFEQYVHMIEMSANGGLVSELDRIREINAGRERQVTLHVVKPAHPLPLDPLFFLGRIDAHTLCAMGYADAIASRRDRPRGSPLTAEATRMTEPPLGVRFRERLVGKLPGLGAVELRLAPLLSGDSGTVVGSLRAVAAPGRSWLRDGTAAVEDDHLRYEALAGDHKIAVVRRLGRSALGGARVSVDGHSARFRSPPGSVLRSALSVEPDGAHNIADRVRVVGSLLTRLGRGRADVAGDPGSRTHRAGLEGE